MKKIVKKFVPDKYMIEYMYYITFLRMNQCLFHPNKKLFTVDAHAYLW